MKRYQYEFELKPGEIIHIGGIPYEVMPSGKLGGANDPKWARDLRDSPIDPAASQLLRQLNFGDQS